LSILSKNYKVRRLGRMTSFKPILNLLTLLKEPKSIQELYDSGCFYGWKDLRNTIKICLKAGLIEIERVGWKKPTVQEVLSHSLHKRRWMIPIDLFFITKMGLNLLSFYDGYQLKKALRKEKVRHLTSTQNMPSHPVVKTQHSSNLD